MIPKTSCFNQLLPLLALLLFFGYTTSFLLPSKRITSCRVLTARTTALQSGGMFAEATQGNTLLPSEALPAERYIAVNRFTVRQRDSTDTTAAAKFEKRWAERKSRLAQLPGFRFFSLMRQVPVDPSAGGIEEQMGNYISMTVWAAKDDFTAWRTGEAFKEAHGGGGITDFVKLLSTALFILKGSPKPAFYDAVLPLTMTAPSSASDAGNAPLRNYYADTAADGGWRSVAADGKTLLPGEVFMSQNRFRVKPGKELEFERKWQERESRLREMDGFVAFFIQRRDADKADDGYNYISTTLWTDRAAFDAWRSSQQFGSAHKNAAAAPSSQPAPQASSTATATAAASESIYLGRPELAFYEGKLVLVSTDGI